ncbi:hypothetical protein [Methylocaldum sp.]|uniref:hypothetical protein n=1 Tax=Methylocaldum sp. TaxID=1969727 RepID=UPI002D45FB5C|nr:hypothetical protein [Methylocaldum sp.]HYE34635.1 hypothetical protein [Methylocaldum sp.]
MNKSILLFLTILLYPFTLVQGAESFTHVASVTFEDVAGYRKTRLFKTSAAKCESDLRIVQKQLEAQIGIASIVSAKCGEVSYLAGFFNKQPMGVPYIVDGKRDVLILPGAPQNVCDNLAQLLQRTSPDAQCIMP